MESTILPKCCARSARFAAAQVEIGTTKSVNEMLSKPHGSPCTVQCIHQFHISASGTAFMLYVRHFARSLDFSSSHSPRSFALRLLTSRKKRERRTDGRADRRSDGKAKTGKSLALSLTRLSEFPISSLRSAHRPQAAAAHMAPLSCNKYCVFHHS